LLRALEPGPGRWHEAVRDMKEMRMRAVAWTLAGSLAVLTLGACVPKPQTQRSSEMPVAADGRALFVENCAICHGEDAKGNGPLARQMQKAPKDLTLISLRHGDKFPRAKIMSIVDGYARSDMTGPGMPEFGALLEGDPVPFDSGDGIQSPTPWKLVAILEYIESVQEKRK
jgi:mono/diheme cytochrome c family protein